MKTKSYTLHERDLTKPVWIAIFGAVVINCIQGKNLILFDQGFIAYTLLGPTAAPNNVLLHAVVHPDATAEQETEIFTKLDTLFTSLQALGK